MDRQNQDPRRSTRVPLRLTLEVEGRGYGFKCGAETIVVSPHGALIKTYAGLRAGDRVTLLVHLTGRHAAARIVHISPSDPLQCGIELETPENVWGVTLPPEDWGG